jgi:hypothetical protein
VQAHHRASVYAPARPTRCAAAPRLAVLRRVAQVLTRPAAPTGAPSQTNAGLHAVQAETLVLHRIHERMLSGAASRVKGFAPRCSRALDPIDYAAMHATL